MTSRFEVNRPYFLFGYFDDDFVLPKIDTYVFLGREKELFGEARDWLCFQDAESFAKHGPATTASDVDPADEISVVSFSDQEAESLQDLSSLAQSIQSEGV